MISNKKWFQKILLQNVEFVQKNVQKCCFKYEKRKTNAEKRIFKGFAAIHYASFFGYLDILQIVAPYEHELLTRKQTVFYDKQVEQQIGAESSPLLLALNGGQYDVAQYFVQQLETYTVKYDTYYHFNSASHTILTQAMKVDYNLGKLVLANKKILYNCLKYHEENDQCRSIFLHLIMYGERNQKLYLLFDKWLGDSIFKMYLSTEVLNCADLILKLKQKNLYVMLQKCYTNLNQIYNSSKNQQVIEKLNETFFGFFTLSRIHEIIKLFIVEQQRDMLIKVDNYKIMLKQRIEEQNQLVQFKDQEEVLMTQGIFRTKFKQNKKIKSELLQNKPQTLQHKIKKRHNKLEVNAMQNKLDKLQRSRQSMVESNSKQDQINYQIQNYQSLIQQKLINRQKKELYYNSRFQIFQYESLDYNQINSILEAYQNYMINDELDIDQLLQIKFQIYKDKEFRKTVNNQKLLKLKYKFQNLINQLEDINKQQHQTLKTNIKKRTEELLSGTQNTELQMKVRFNQQSNTTKSESVPQTPIKRMQFNFKTESSDNELLHGTDTSPNMIPQSISIMIH